MLICNHSQEAAQGTRLSDTIFGAQDTNSACNVTEVGPQRAVDELLYNKYWPNTH